MASTCAILAVNLLLIPGTSSVAHLAENLASERLELALDVRAELDDIATR